MQKISFILITIIFGLSLIGCSEKRDYVEVSFVLNGKTETLLLSYGYVITNWDLAHLGGNSTDEEWGGLFYDRQLSNPYKGERLTKRTVLYVEEKSRLDSSVDLSKKAETLINNQHFDICIAFGSMITSSQIIESEMLAEDDKEIFLSITNKTKDTERDYYNVYLAIKDDVNILFIHYLYNEDCYKTFEYNFEYELMDIKREFTLKHKLTLTDDFLNGSNIEYADEEDQIGYEASGINFWINPDNSIEHKMIKYRVIVEGIEYEAIRLITTEEIREDYFNLMVDTNSSTEFEKLYVGEVFGVYGDSVALIMLFKGITPPPAVDTVVVEGFEFSFHSGRHILIWNNNNFYTLQNAFDESLITLENLETIHSIHKHPWPN